MSSHMINDRKNIYQGMNINGPHTWEHRKPIKYKANSYEGEGGRERTIPKSKQKHYPTKPKRLAKVHRNKYFKYL